jgi:pyruvate formate lyase activating enzyme
MKEALLYRQLDSSEVVCDLCLHQCHIKPGRRGVCGVRVNSGGTLYTLVYDRVAAIHVDPIEKKPFFHFQPGSASLSLATIGCNMHCLYCQNHYLSQLPKEPQGRIVGEPLTPEEIVQTAQSHRCRSIAYTYTEPTVFFELAYDTARLAKAQGLKNLLVTNGYMSPAALRMIRPYIDGASVDLKGFKDRPYRRVCGARLRPVLESIQFMHELGLWVEVTTLVVPGHNDSDEELQRIAEFLASVSYDIPWHVSAFFPAYKMLDRPATSVETIHRAYSIGRNVGLHYVYCGNIPGSFCTSTYCHQCRTNLIERCGCTVLSNWIVNGRCPHCGASVAGVEMSQQAAPGRGTTLSRVSLHSH